jgi:hypothetical protein
MKRSVSKGQNVVFVDEDRIAHCALVTINWGSPGWDDEKPLVPGENWPTCLNLVYVLKDDTRTDQYGNQTRHVTSVVHESVQTAGGYMWKFA